ncbi:MAG: DNA methyltransferase [Gammaproteobacteria bacterium]
MIGDAGLSNGPITNRLIQRFIAMKDEANQMDLFSRRSATEENALDDVGTLPQSHRQLITVLPPADVFETLQSLPSPVKVVMLDPWYNKGFGGVRDDYDDWIVRLVGLSGDLAEHVYVWGFPEIVWRLLNRLPKSLSLVTWLTWYYKNCPSVIRGWRSAQYTCLHLAQPDAKLYPEHFLNSAQLEKQQQGKLRYMPGPPSVIDVPLNIGFVGRNEQTGHPSQKPEKVYEPLYLMTTKPGDVVVDPMCGSGTTGSVCARLGVHSILCDESEEYTVMAEARLGITRRRNTRVRTRKSPA